MYIFLVGIGGFAGAIARFSISNALNKSEYSIPIGTLTVNLLGALLLGVITGLKSEEIALLFGTGFMGAFTTFSTFKFEAIKLHQKQKKSFAFYIIIPYGSGIVLAFLGYVIGKTFYRFFM
nr:fluoride efflux transporter CrcB [Lentibacillus jeotgali]